MQRNQNVQRSINYQNNQRSIDHRSTTNNQVIKIDKFSLEISNTTIKLVRLLIVYV